MKGSLSSSPLPCPEREWGRCAPFTGCAEISGYENRIWETLTLWKIVPREPQVPRVGWLHLPVPSPVSPSRQRGCAEGDRQGPSLEAGFPEPPPPPSPALVQPLALLRRVWAETLAGGCCSGCSRAWETATHRHRNTGEPRGLPPSPHAGCHTLQPRTSRPWPHRGPSHAPCAFGDGTGWPDHAGGRQRRF